MSGHHNYGTTDVIVSAGTGGPDISGTVTPSDWFVQWANGGQRNDTGIVVNGDTVLTSGPVWQAVNIIAGDVAKLPLHLYRRLPDGDKERDDKHPAYWLLEHEPNEYMTPYVFRQTMQAWCLLWGNACAYIVRDGRGDPVELIPLKPDSIGIEEDKQGGGYYYYYWQDGQMFQFAPKDVLHIRGLGNALWGYSIIEKAANTIGYNLGLQRYGALHFKQGGRPSGVIQLSQRMPPEDRRDMRREWEDIHNGIDNAHKIAILQAGATFSPFMVSNESAEFLGSIKNSVDQVAAIFNLPPYKLGSMENSSVRANLEQQNQDYLDTTLSQPLLMFEQECRRKLLTFKQRKAKAYYFKFNVNALLRSDIHTRMTAYSIGRQWGIYNVNEIRNLEDLNNIGPQGDIYLHPLNMVDADTGHPVGEDPAEQQQDEQQQQQDPPDNNADDMPNAQALAAVAIVYRDAADRMCRREAEQVKRLARKPNSNFVDDVAKFYRGWNTSLCGALRASAEAAMVLNCTTTDMTRAVETYCDLAANRLLDIAGSVTTTEALAESVDNYAESWQANSHQLMTLFLGDQNHASIHNSGW